ncbi:hypothetical protein [Psychromarinibacter halotolerans]|uniref:Uncharacterized protein n=1 Tax=Psychromarinibacter halotolerans TaxID=1775175 RepID=A0ABV7H092_9RHOB|nr:hypothetical protein [Psychromarinibacter halotolerans]MDF0596393.1 hypothetical protein [Psychromarinibacter halotolerans]
MIVLLGLFHVLLALVVGAGFARFGPATGPGRGICAFLVSACVVPLATLIAVGLYFVSNGLSLREAADAAAFVSFAAVLTVVAWGPVTVLVAVKGHAGIAHPQAEGPPDRTVVGQE